MSAGQRKRHRRLDETLGPEEMVASLWALGGLGAPGVRGFRVFATGAITAVGLGARPRNFGGSGAPPSAPTHPDGGPTSPTPRLTGSDVVASTPPGHKIEGENETQGLTRRRIRECLPLQPRFLSFAYSISVPLFNHFLSLILSFLKIIFFRLYNFNIWCQSSTPYFFVQPNRGRRG